MLRAHRTGAVALVLGLGCWIASESGAGASPGKEPGSAKQGHSHPSGASTKTVTSPHSAASAKSPGAGNHADLGIGKHSGFVNGLEHKLEREEAEISRLERSLDNLLDGADDGGPSFGSQGSPSGSAPISSSGAPSNSNASANPTNPSQHHHRHGHMWRGMELARLMHDMASEERTLARQEGNLERQLTSLRDQERNLRNLHTAGQKTGSHHFANQEQARNGKSNHTETRSAKSGEHIPRITGQTNTGHAAGQNQSNHLHAGSGSPAGGHSYALSAARGVGKKMNGHPVKNHH